MYEMMKKDNYSIFGLSGLQFLNDRNHTHVENIITKLNTKIKNIRLLGTKSHMEMATINDDFLLDLLIK
jgi:hypothetical protein